MSGAGAADPGREGPGAGGAGPIGGATRVGAVIGWPVEHSASPALQNAAFRALGIDAVFVALPVEPARLDAAIRGMAALGFLGASVTVPHKRAALEACDEVDPQAAAIGAVNCLVFAPGGRVVGHNTDAGGFTDALAEELARPVHRARAVLLGAGGAARAVAAGLKAAGAGSVEVVARRPEAAAAWCPSAHPFTADTLAALLPACDLLIDCTPVGLAAAAGATAGNAAGPAAPAGGFAAPVPLDALPASAAVATLVYHRDTELLARARALGLATLDGAGMLVHQGARAFTLWTGRPAPLAAMRAALRARAA